MTAMRLLLLCSLIIGVSTPALAVKDSLVLSNGNTIVGEIKNMDLGVLQIETDYSDSDFKIEWSGVRQIFSETSFLITLEDGERYTGSLRSIDETLVSIRSEGVEIGTTPRQEIVYLKEVEQGFLSRLYANIDVGFSLTKAQTQQQLTVNTRGGYLADYYTLDAYFNDLFSSQDSVTPIRRTDYGAGFRYLLPADWFLSFDASFLSNTEQALRLRTNLKLGAGNFIVHNNRVFWSFSGGAASNFEDFSNETESRNSLEAFFGTEVNFFNFGDLSLLLNVFAYPSLTESGRWRSDGRFDAKYDLPLDFYIRAGITVNYDNQPAAVGRELDYVFTTGLGWEW